ncbi:hypothetical protein CCICO_04335 [Corynebacterium ciconiae DSM 44920]|uniref:hypothetical protein n=1 Tax=Corynebacterium ciconiae TaxID=227319 RepID=UPI0026473BA6|nr:hypothetical protein [Corynebacterium ciconiae]WKD60904.1 hypothetical protein CCICO_04335 [Corynebacterium ciconiae DSM 44920]
MNITPEQARARLESKPTASRIERRAYRTIAGMTYEYAVQYLDENTGGWEWLAPEWETRWGDYSATCVQEQRDRFIEETRIVRRLVGEPEVFE